MYTLIDKQDAGLGNTCCFIDFQQYFFIKSQGGLLSLKKVRFRKFICLAELDFIH